MMNEDKSLRIDRIVSTLFCCVLFIARYGYTFNCGDQEEHLPYVYRLLNPALYPHDYLVPFQVSTFTVRYYFAHLLAFAGSYFPVRPVVLFFQLLTLAVFSSFISAVAYSFYPRRSVIYTAPVLALVIFNTWTTGGNAVFDMQLTCNSFAMAAGASGMFAVIRKRYLVAAFFCATGSLFQVLTGLQAFLVVVIISIADREKEELLRLVKMFFVYLLFAAPMLLPVLQLQFNNHAPGSTAFYTHILFAVRNPHHYLVNHFPVRDYFKTIFLVVITALSLYYTNIIRMKRIYLAVMISIVGGCIIYVILMNGFHLAAAGKTQWFKATVWLVFWAAVCLSVCIDKLFDHQLNYLLRPAILLLFSIATLVVVSQAVFRLPAVYSNRYQFGYEKQTDLRLMHQWIRDHTDRGAVFLTMPGDDSFLCEAQRSLITGYKGIIHEKAWLLNWYKTYTSIYGVSDPEADADLLSASVSHYPAVVPRNPVQFMVTDADSIPFKGDIIFRQGTFKLVRKLN